MPGFYVSNTDVDVCLHDLYPERCVAEEIDGGGVFTAKRNTLNKFMQDKCLDWNGKSLVAAEGYLLNKAELFETYQVHTMAELARKMYALEGEQFFNAFRGSFSGALYDVEADKWLVYTNHTGDNPVFYAVFEGAFYAASQVTYLVDAIRKAGHGLHLDEDGAYQIMTFGFMERDNTYAQEIRRLRGGTYLRVEKGKAEVRQYHMFHKHPERFAGKSEGEIIDALDEAFRHAVELEYRKDEEYGYAHLADMSGGLDSRMSAWVAHENKPRHIQLLTYCRANYLDELVAKQIAGYWKDELLVKPLDDMSFIYDVDEIVAMTGGASLYMGITGGKRMLESLNAQRYGLEHTGMVGDVVIGSYCKSVSDLEQRLPTGKYSEKLSGRIKADDGFREQFDDHELYLLYTRGFQGMAGTYLIRKNYTEATAAFMEHDLFQLCMDIPLELRAGHHIYFEWIKAKYPQAAAYKWEKTGGKIGESHAAAFARKVVRYGPDKLLRMMGHGGKFAVGMNPVDYWLAHDEHAREYLDSYFEETCPKLRAIASTQLFQDVQDLYCGGNASEKSMAITVLGAVKLYFGN